MRFTKYMFLASICAVQVVSAQQVNAVVQASDVSSRGAQVVTLKLEQVPLKVAISELARVSGVRINYRDETLPKRLVSVDVRNEPWRVVIGKLLKYTNLSVQAAEGGQFLLVPSNSSASRANGVIAGKVVDAKTGNPVSGATISLGDDRRASTSDDGSYRLSNVTAGTYVVAARIVGYAKQMKSVTVGEGATVTVDFKLNASANVLDQVIVTGTVVQTELKAVPSAITVVTAKQIEERGITRIDQLFRGEIPGLFSLEMGSVGVSTFNTPSEASLDEVFMSSRGAATIGGIQSQPAIKTYIDGVELANPRYLSQLDPKSIERIEILTGPQASTIYGAGAINGVMQIFTKRGTSTRPSITLGLSEGLAQNNFSSALASSHQYDGSISGLEGKFSYNVGSSWDYTGAWSPSKQSQRTNLFGGGRYQSGALSIDLTARQGWTSNYQRGAAQQARTEMVAVGKYNTTNSSLSALVTPSKRFLSGRTVGTTVTYTPFAWWSHQIGAGTDASDTERRGMAIGFKIVDDSSMSNNQSFQSRTSQNYSSTLRIPVRSNIQATLTYGGDHWRTRSSSVTWSKLLNGSIGSSSISRARPDKNTGLYVQSQLGLNDELFITYGLRADWNPNYGENARVRPGRYGLAYSKEVGDISAKLRASYGRSITPPGQGVRQGFEESSVIARSLFAPSGTPLYNSLPNAELGPEFQQGGEGGIELYWGRIGSISLTRYNQTVDGLITSLFPFDSVRALDPGLPASFFFLCANTTQLHADGYCYYPQSKQVNAASIRNQGWESQISANYGPFTVRSTYSWTKSRVIGVTSRYRSLITAQSYFPGQTFNFIPEHAWATNLLYSRGGTSVTFNVNAVGQTLRDVDQTPLGVITDRSFLRFPAQDAYRLFPQGQTFRISIAGYATANVNASHRFASNVDATLQVTNLTDQYRNDYNSIYPVLGRQSRAGVRIKFQ